MDTIQRYSLCEYVRLSKMRNITRAKMLNLGASIWRTILYIKLLCLPWCVPELLLSHLPKFIAFYLCIQILPSKCWPHFSWATLYIQSYALMGHVAWFMFETCRFSCRSRQGRIIQLQVSDNSTRFFAGYSSWQHRCTRSCSDVSKLVFYIEYFFISFSL